MLLGIIFDLDGTLVDSKLDFDAMRREMRLPEGTPILEAMKQLPPQEANRCRQILARHEETGAQQAVLMPGVREFFSLLTARGIKRALLTRNTRHLTLGVLERFGLKLDPVFTREDGPVKPDPSAVLQILEHWTIAPEHALVIGDFHFDIEAGRRAGVPTALFTGSENSHDEFAEQADYVFASYRDAAAALFGDEL